MLSFRKHYFWSYIYSVACQWYLHPAPHTLPRRETLGIYLLPLYYINSSQMDKPRDCYLVHFMVSPLTPWWWCQSYGYIIRLFFSLQGPLHFIANNIKHSYTYYYHLPIFHYGLWLWIYLQLYWRCPELLMWRQVWLHGMRSMWYPHDVSDAKD